MIKPLNILLADDDIDDRHFFKMALDALSTPNKLESVVDGEKLMTYLAAKCENLPDILFLDINMPRKNGLECLEEIKKNVLYKDLSVIMFSSLKSMDKIKLVFNLGSHVFVTKPGDINQLKLLIMNALPIAAQHKHANKPLKYILNA